MTRRTWRERATGGLTLWVVFAGLEILMVGKFDPQETPVGLAVAAVVAAGAIAVYENTEARYRPAAAWLGLLPRLFASAVRDTLLIYGLLLRRLAGGPVPDGRIVEVPYDGAGEDPHSAAHRAVAVWAVSFAPNSVALYENDDRGTLSVHYLAPGKAKPQSAEWPI